MIFDFGTVAVLILAAALAGLLLGLLPSWRRMMNGDHTLPMWVFLRRRHAGVDGRAALQAEMRCALCGQKAECERQLATGADSPIPGCLNSKLLQER